MALIIEELNRAQRVQARYRMRGDRFSIGRGYDNDLILEDAYADAAHAEIVRGEDGGYYLRDLDSVNGIALLGNAQDKSVKSQRLTERRIQSGDLFGIGKSRLRIALSETALAPALPMHSLENLFERISHPGLAALLVLAVAAISLLVEYLANARDYEWTDAINLVTGVTIVLLLYAGFWALIGRVARHEARFFSHLSIAGLGALAFAGWERLSDLLNFNYALGNVVSILHFAVLALLLPALLWCASFLALNISSRWRWALALLLPWGFLAVGAAEQVKSLREFNEQPQYSSVLKYKDVLWRKPVPMREFIADSSTLFDIPIKKSKKSSEAEAEEADAEQQKAQGNKEEQP